MTEYEPRIKLFITLLTLLGILACLYVPLAAIKVSSQIYTRTASPHNTDWMGTSTFISMLKKWNYSITIAESLDEFVRSVKSSDLVIIIAPDKQIPKEAIKLLYKGFTKGEVNILVADENTTSNELLLQLAGLGIDGRAIFSRMLSSANYSAFPEAIIYPSINNAKYVPENISASLLLNNISRLTLMEPKNGTFYALDLNWASPIAMKTLTKPKWIKAYYLMGITKGILDVDNDGKITKSDISSQPKYWPTSGSSLERPFVVGLRAQSTGNRSLIVFGDSFFFTNQALGPYKSPYRYLIKAMFEEHALGRKVVICDFLYNTVQRALAMPYHPSILLYLVAFFLSLVDSKITGFVLLNQGIAVSVAISLILVITLLVLRAMGIKYYADIRLADIEEVGIIVETEVKRKLMKGEILEKPKETIESAWGILNYVLRKTEGYEVKDLLENSELLGSLSHRTGLDKKILEARLKWLMKIHNKVSKGSMFPIVISWKRTLKKYLIITDEVLKSVGFTLFRRGGLKGVESVLH